MACHSAASFRELIFFENERALERFQSGEFALTADATAVAASAAAAKTNYRTVWLSSS